MFTGIVEEQGRILALEPTQTADGGDHQVESVRLTIEAPLAVSDAFHGASISVSGVCLTVVDFDDTSFSADVMNQTLQMSSLGGKTVGDRVNIERAMSAASDSRFGGHIVQGHVDTTAEVLSVHEAETWRVLRFGIGYDYAPLLVAQGSITVDGVSLTISDVSGADLGPEDQHWFEVSLIPETLRATTLGERVQGDIVNIETDILARHVARLQQFRTAAATTATPGENSAR